jgi:hypothetical protein
MFLAGYRDALVYLFGPAERLLLIEMRTASQAV